MNNLTINLTIVFNASTAHKGTPSFYFSIFVPLYTFLGIYKNNIGVYHDANFV